MKPISVSIYQPDYEAFKEAAKEQGRPVAHLIREAMALYRAERLDQKEPLKELPVLPGHRAVGQLPSRADVWDEVFEGDDS